MKTYIVGWNGKLLSVEAIVGPGTRVRVFSIRDLDEDGVVVQGTTPRAAERARSNRTDHAGDDPNTEADKVTALSAWPQEDREAFYDLIRASHT